ncbi:MAG: hypothetical protein GHCLOJNM_00166 [bacterium]|nr:hypothetical protein [bacterium]
MARLFLFIVFGLLSYPISARAEEGQASAITEVPAAATHTVSFDKEIKPILNRSCVQCHGRGKARGGFKIDSRETLLAGGENGPVLEIGKSQSSRLIRLVAGVEKDEVMPPDGERLTPEKVGLLRAWIDQGLEWEEGFSFGRFKEAPLSPHRPEIPVAEARGSTNPIDRFLEPYFESHDVQPREPVSDRVFARRVYLDVTGLLPTPEELEAFLRDPDPNKRDKLVDSLLERNQAYAEHWMSFWNDALRNDFAGTGYIDGGRKQISAWLYQALKSNLPYDEFVAQLIHPVTGSEGFIKGIVWRGVVNSSQTPEMQAAQNVSQVFLGINLKCASCHDSFISNWKLEDAYNLASAFAPKPLGIFRCDTATGATATAKFLYSELGSIPADAGREIRLARLAEILTSEKNGRLTRTIVNRLWTRFHGRGLVEPVDEMDNDPWHPDLLDWLAVDLAESGYDLKHAIRLMLTSRAYQLPSVSLDLLHQQDYVFEGPAVRRLSSEQFRDALAAVVDVWPATPATDIQVSEDPSAPGRVRAWHLKADPLAVAMGRPNREQVVTHRASLATTLEILELTNGQTLSEILKQGAAELLASGSATPEEITRHVFRSALGREPTPEEWALASELLGEQAKEEGVQDLLWAVAMLPEFQLIY